MRILILANDSGGLYNFRKELIAELLKKKNKVSAYTPNGGFVEELDKLGCKVNDLHLDRRGIDPRKDIKLFLSLCKIVSQEKPDLVITYTIKPNIYGSMVCRLKKIPYAVNITGLGTAFQQQGFLRTMVTTMYRFALKKAKTVFFENSENMQLFVNKRIICKKQAKLLNGAGVNLDRFSLLPYPKDCEEIRFLFMGRVMAEKGVDELFAAMRNLQNDNVKCSLDMLGSFDENYAAKIKTAEDEGWLRYHGVQADVRPFINNCHCFVLPSYHEGMANTNLECASSGRPVITSNIHGCLEAVEDGVTGYLVESKNSDNLYQVMKEFTKLSYEERKAMGLAGRKRMENVFDKKKVVAETITGLE